MSWKAIFRLTNLRSTLINFLTLNSFIINL